MSNVVSSVLELDIGNTRLKWRVRSAQVVLGSGAVAYFDLGVAVALQAITHECLGLNVETVLVGSVAGSVVDKLVRRWALSELACEPLFAEVAECSNGVSCAYDDVAKFGVDRWLGLLSAHRLSSVGAIVVDCGSAVTVDVLVAGEHQGGYIVPGFRLLSTSLAKDTSKVKADFVAPKNLSLGQNTADCVNHGVALMVLGLVEKVVSSVSERDGDLPIIFTGGDGEIVMKWLLASGFKGWSDYVADLVIDGLELAGCQALVV